MVMQPGRPTLYCDVDGVINIATRKREGLNHRIIYRRLPSIGSRLMPVPLRIRWQENLISSLAELKVNFFWLTTWNHQAVSILEPLTGIKSHGVLNYKMPLWEAVKQRSKYELLKQHQNVNPSPFIWIDDVATQHYKEEDFQNAPEHLVIRTDKRHGITETHLEQITSFVQAF